MRILPHDFRQWSRDRPGLSNVGREMTVDEIQAKLANPSSRITPGYELASVHCGMGRPFADLSGIAAILTFDCRI